MNLFLYYACHTFKNQLKKLLKTWVLIFILICALMGGLIGVMVAHLEDTAEEMNGPDADTVQVDENYDEPGAADTDDILSGIGVDEELSESEELMKDIAEGEFGKVPMRIGITGLEFMELIIGLAVIACFVMFMMNADKNGSKIFLPADVNLLFASPMRPQSVLMFRLCCQLGLMLFITAYMLFQLPNLILNAGLSVPAAFSLLVGWFFMLIYGTLFQVLVYVEAGTHAAVKKYLRPVLYTVLFVIVAAYIVTWKTSGLSYAAAASKLLGASWMRWIPAWGWIKGLCMFMTEGEILKAVICFVLLTAGAVVLVKIIQSVKADFYEDAMAKSEETAAALERARSEKAGGLTSGVKRKKDRSDSLRRDGMKHGFGANVFFFKAMYNRFRFAHLHFFTKTMETYIVSSIAIGLLCRIVFETDVVLPLALTLSGMAFFRAMGNPVEEDTKMDYFMTIPEPAFKKLFWSLMGALANCALDIIPAMIIGTLIGGGNLASACWWILFILPVFFYATTVGTFINLSVPVNAGKMVKQFVQIIFIYFGLLPDIAIMAFGIVLKHTSTAILGCVALNIALGLIFFLLSPAFIEPSAKKAKRVVTEFNGDLKKVKSDFSRIGLAAFIMLGLTSVIQIALGLIMNNVYPEWYQVNWLYWCVTFVPLYVICVPLGLLILRKVPVNPLPQKGIRLSSVPSTMAICLFLMYAGNIIGALVNYLIGLITNIPIGNPLENFATEDSIFIKILVMVVLAPVIEEFIFRKQLIDRMNVYGERLAVVMSGVMFGMFHGNFSQFFYAAALGICFGYIYVKTGRLRYSIGLHMFINFLGSVLSVEILKGVDLEALNTMSPYQLLAGEIPDGLVAYGIYIAFMLLMAVVGLVVLIIKLRRIRFNYAENPLPKGKVFNTVCVNVGMILFLIATLALISMQIFQIHF